MVRRKKKRSGNEYDYVVLLLILSVAISFYFYNFKGISLDYDDAMYAYSIIHPTYLIYDTIFSGSLGYAILGQFYYLILGNSMVMPTILGASSIVITIIVIFLIGKEYDRVLVGALAAVLYAFNPIVFAYSNRLLPDTFTTMLLALSILFLLKASKGKGRNSLYALSCFLAALGFFFGMQAIFTLLAFFAFLLVRLWKSHEWKKPVMCAVLGVAIAVFLYVLPQEVLLGKPLATATSFSSIFTTQEIPHSVNYFLHILLPLGPAKGGGTTEPTTNLGVLTILFLIANLTLLTKNKMKLLPYTVSSAAIIIYVMYGTSSISGYVPIIGENRFFMPLAMLFAVGVALAVDSISKRSARISIALLIIMLSLYSSLPVYDNANSYYSLRLYNLTNSMQENLRNSYNPSYKLYENVIGVQTGICYALKPQPQNCVSALTLPIPCNETRIMLILNKPSCGNDYFYHNSTFGYYAYLKN